MNNHWTKRNILYLALALVIGIGIWFYVDERDARTATVMVYDVPIEYVGESGLADRGLMLLSGEGSGTDLKMNFELEGLRRKVVQMDNTKIRVTVDLSKITSAGVQTVNYTQWFTDRRFGSTVIQIKDTSIYTATVNIVELNRKDIEVRCELVGNVAEGYTAGKLNLSKDMIEVRGQAEDIEAVSYAKVTLNVGKDVKESVSQVLQCSFYDEQDNLLADREIHTKDLEITATLPVYVTKELKLTLDFQESAGAKLENMVWSMTPESIMVSGDASILNGVDSIILASFDLMDVGTEPSSHSYAVIVPDGCENLSGVTRATLDISYPELSDRTVEIEKPRFRIENAPEGKEVTILTESVVVNAFGPSVVVSTITTEDVELVIDLSNYVSLSGTCTVSAEARTSDELDVGFRGPCEVQVNIHDKANLER